MIKNFKCVNISSKNPKALADFYISIGAPIFIEDGNYDGWFIGNPKQGGMKIAGVSLQRDLLLLF